MDNIEFKDGKTYEKSTGREIVSPLDAGVSLETCDCDKTVLHDGICPFCKLRYLENENKHLKEELATEKMIVTDLLSQIRELEKHCID